MSSTFSVARKKSGEDSIVRAVDSISSDKLAVAVDCATFRLQVSIKENDSLLVKVLVDFIICQEIVISY